MLHIWEGDPLHFHFTSGWYPCRYPEEAPTKKGEETTSANFVCRRKRGMGAPLPRLGGLGGAEGRGRHLLQAGNQGQDTRMAEGAVGPDMGQLHGGITRGAIPKYFPS